MNDILLEVDNLHVSYGKVEVLHGVSLCLQRGSIATVIGPNGAGKSTLLNALMGIEPSRGSIRFEGRAIGCSALEQRVLDGIGLVPERRELFSSMSVEDNLALGAFRRVLLGESQPLGELDHVFTVFPRLKERRKQLAGTLSGGERQMLAIGRALMARPTLLMLDEPSLGLAPLIVRDILRIVAELAESGISILLVEQNARAALQVAHYGYVLELGRVALQGAPALLAGDRQVVNAYLGLGGAPGPVPS